MKEKMVVITVSGGVAEVYHLPVGVIVKIVDYDIEGEDEERLDEYEGEPCVISEHATLKEF